MCESDSACAFVARELFWHASATAVYNAVFEIHRRLSPAHRSAREGDAMAKNISVGNLTWEATPGDLLGLFDQDGAVARAPVSTAREAARSRGCALGVLRQ